MKKELVCVICPNGCFLEADVVQGESGTEVRQVEGALCKKGVKWASQELVEPLRTIASSVLVEGGEIPLASVRTDQAIPLEAIGRVMEEIKKITVRAPVRIGDVILVRPSGAACNIIATRNVSPKGGQ
ncbi:MAG: DUF1667 domain-containing protein [Deltaproteobacteria bacterium]|nr:DUF1667 domain-containing protein [Deltaproteobacteria bacterium]MBW2121294.1 DUF1667 domain-containing protein [Deltaproteobacteria bacterium]HDZ91678.1 DUF1667 domain-containing protein [Deltaproteobacteria bacterium]